MTNAQHTPGPLQVRQTSSGAGIAYSLDAPEAYKLAIAQDILGLDDARLLAAAYTSYDKHCADPIAAAEADLLGKALNLLADAHDRLADFIGSDCECDNTHEANGTTCCLCQYSALLTRAGKDGQ